MGVHRSFTLFEERSVLLPTLLVCLGSALAGGLLPGPAVADLWKAADTLPTSQGSRFPAGSRVFTLDRDALDSYLDLAPSADHALHHVAGLPEISLPMPDGSCERFTFHLSRTLSPGFAARFPEIRAFAGTGRSSRWRVRFELTPKGFEAAVWSPQGKVVIESIGAEDRYASAFLRDLAPEPGAQALSCLVESDPAVEREFDALVERTSRGSGPAVGDLLRTYRLAVAATGEYTGQHGGTVAGAMAEITETINRINEIMGQEWSVALEIIPNNDLVVYTDPATDPYTFGEHWTMLDENQANLDAVIGSANYDIGHVFTGGNNGVADSSPCNPASKGKGVSTGGSTLHVAHEMGHQFGSTHTFNGNEGLCSERRVGSTAYEPGSGSTIMAYAGLCGSQNIQGTPHDYYHTGTYTRVISNITGGWGSICPVVTATGNTPPVAVAGNAGNTIPIDTPFVLDGSGTDADGDDLTYCWEQYDLGPGGHPDFPEGEAPLFRSRRPKTVSERFFPKIQRILWNEHVIGELLPFYARNMRFRLTVRDGLGGVHWDDVEMTVVDTAGPFLVTSHATSETLAAGSQIMVTWDVANTDNVDVNCQTVNILMADDRQNYDYVLATGTPNDGSEMVTVPEVNTTQARIQVLAAGNIFFDINDADLTVTGAVGVETVASVPGLRLEPARPNPFNGNTTIAYSIPASTHAKLGVYNAAGRLVRGLVNGRAAAGRHSASWNGTSRDGSVAASGIYFVRLETDRGDTRMQKVHLVR